MYDRPTTRTKEPQMTRTAPKHTAAAIATRIDEIAAAHGCDVVSVQGGTQRAIAVWERYRQGWPADGRRIAGLRQALAAEGIDASGWLS